mgnify:CR=1 FL=1
MFIFKTAPSFWLGAVLKIVGAVLKIVGAVLKILGAVLKILGAVWIDYKSESE